MKVKIVTFMLQQLHKYSGIWLFRSPGNQISRLFGPNPKQILLHKPNIIRYFDRNFLLMGPKNVRTNKEKKLQVTRVQWIYITVYVYYIYTVDIRIISNIWRIPGLPGRIYASIKGQEVGKVVWMNNSKTNGR